MGTYVRIWSGGKREGIGIRGARAGYPVYPRLVRRTEAGVGRGRWRPIVALAVAALALLAGCAKVGHTAGNASEPAIIERSRPGDRARAAEDAVAQSHCPAGLHGCRTTEGPIVYVERVDPDGDGDAHFVVVDSQGITLPGLTAIDVRKGLRPHPLPGVGEEISAAGPLETGSHGQTQIAAVEVHAR